MSSSAARLDTAVRAIRKERERITSQFGGGRNKHSDAHLRQISLISSHLSRLGKEADRDNVSLLDDLRNDQLSLSKHRLAIAGSAYNLNEL